MPNYKNYENEELRNKLLQIFANERYGNFNGAVIDAFLRRAYEFDMPETRILEEAQNFEKCIESIKFVYGEGFKIETWSGATYGVSSDRKGRIEINGEYYKRRLAKAGELGKEAVFADMYETLIHEIFHGIGKYLTEIGYGTALKSREDNRRNQ